MTREGLGFLESCDEIKKNLGTLNGNFVKEGGNFPYCGFLEPWVSKDGNVYPGWKMFFNGRSIRHQVKVVDSLNGVLPPQHAVQVNDGPLKAKADHTVEVIGNHCYLTLSNMKGVSSIPPPLDETLHHGSTCRPFQKKANDRHKARFPDISPSLKNEKVIPLHHLVNASPTSIRG